MFSQVCVKNSVRGGGVHGWGHAWQGAYVVGGMHGRGCAWQGGMRGRGMCGRGDVCGRGACVAGETATAADGTHPTGMHSCSQLFLRSLITKTKLSIFFSYFFHNISKCNWL